MLQIQQLCKQYPGGEHALRGVDLQVPAGQVAMLIGPSGAGKSTLVKCVNRLVEPSAGVVRVADTTITALRGRALRHARRRVGMIFQDFGLVDRLSVMENVLCGRLGHVGFWRSVLTRFPEEDVARALALIERVGLRDHVDKRADALSGGQRQRVAIARALIQTDELILVDEPTASLDPRTARSVMRLIVQLSRERGLTALINIHDVPLARHFGDRVIGLHEGRVVFDDAPDKLDDAALVRIYGEEEHAVARPASSDRPPSDDAQPTRRPDPALPVAVT